MQYATIKALLVEEGYKVATLDELLKAVEGAMESNGKVWKDGSKGAFITLVDVSIVYKTKDEVVYATFFGDVDVKLRAKGTKLEIGVVHFIEKSTYQGKFYEDARAIAWWIKNPDTKEVKGYQSAGVFVRGNIVFKGDKTDTSSNSW